ncbi:YesL family protein [Sediminibacillus massiliensis]|uniref:YesL family protein n=1 Tax=Sediminibacillus massiliensis TaxID=1926277 RepID=UPI0009883F37|nr:DUF624 domain-containing protein [Sediminibacillus massiliensis]
METGLSGGLYKACIWLARLAYLNLLWLLFTFAGLVVVGFFPATAAMFKIERKWLEGEEELPLFSVFVEECKKSFLTANLLGYLLVLFGLLLVINYRLATAMDGVAGDMIGFFLLGLGVVYVIVVAYLYPVYVYYDVKSLDHIKYALVIGVSSPVVTLLMVVGIILFIYFSSVFPGVIPVYGGSFLSFILMGFSYSAFKRLEQKHLPQADERVG